jgi:hypothetical protein
MYTLSELVQSRPAIAAPVELTDDQWQALVLARMRAHSVYQFASPLGRVRTPADAIDAIENKSVIGERIVAQQRELVTRLVSEVAESDGTPTNAG